MTEIKIDPKRWPALVLMFDARAEYAGATEYRERYGFDWHSSSYDFRANARAELAGFVAEREATATVRAAKTCEAMVVGGRAWNHDQAVAADALLTAANKIREPKP